MNKDILVRVKGIQGGSPEEVIETITPGLYFNKGGKDTIKYEDRSLEDGQVTHTTVKIEGKKVTVIRHGAANTRLVYEEGEVRQTPYETPFGIFELAMMTQKVQIMREEDSLVLEVDFTIEISGSGPTPSKLYMELTNLL